MRDSRPNDHPAAAPPLAPIRRYRRHQLQGKPCRWRVRANREPERASLGRQGGGEVRSSEIMSCRTSGPRPRGIAEEFEISVDSVRCWIRRARIDSGERKDGLTTPEHERASEIEDRHPARADGARDPGKSRSMIHSGYWFDPVRTLEFARAYQGTCPITMMCRVLVGSTSWLRKLKNHGFSRSGPHATPRPPADRLSPPEARPIRRRKIGAAVIAEAIRNSGQEYRPAGRAERLTATHPCAPGPPRGGGVSL